MTARLIALAIALLVATAVGFLVRRWNGHFRGAAKAVGSAGVGAADADAPARTVVVSDEIGAALGERATLLQFSSAFCAPCRATRRVLADVAAIVPGVAHVEVDAESHLDLVRRLGVMRTPTTFVLDNVGAVVTRSSGQPGRDAVIAALATAVS